MRLRRLGLVFAAVVAVGSAAAPASAAPPAPAGITLPPQLTQCSTTPYQGDSRLGPDRYPLPLVSEVGTQLLFYNRTGGMSTAAFLAKYYDSAAGSWIYPPSNGYRLDRDGDPIEYTRTLQPGADIDRYGSEYGGFLSPRGTLYLQRAIPPSNLNTYDPAYTCNYHKYRVLKALPVHAGPIAAWFAQPGGGLQYQLDGALIPGAPAQVNVLWLIDNGYVSRLN